MSGCGPTTTVITATLRGWPYVQLHTFIPVCDLSVISNQRRSQQALFVNTGLHFTEWCNNGVRSENRNSHTDIRLLARLAHVVL